MILLISDTHHSSWVLLRQHALVVCMKCKLIHSTHEGFLRVQGQGPGSTFAKFKHRNGQTDLPNLNHVKCQPWTVCPTIFVTTDHKVNIFSLEESRSKRFSQSVQYHIIPISNNISGCDLSLCSRLHENELDTKGRLKIPKRQNQLLIS